jgi:hypothetical protein
MSAFETRGEGPALAALAATPARFNSGVAKAAAMAGGIVTRRIKQDIESGTKSGRLYPGRQRSSAPGESAANQSGGLARSFGYTASATELHVGSNSKIAKILEGGTSRMKPRPSLKLGADETQSTTHQVLGSEVFKELKGR